MLTKIRSLVVKPKELYEYNRYLRMSSWKVKEVIYLYPYVCSRTYKICLDKKIVDNFDFLPRTKVFLKRVGPVSV